jgi:hypothetical protein
MKMAPTTATAATISFVAFDLKFISLSSHWSLGVKRRRPHAFSICKSTPEENAWELVLLTVALSREFESGRKFK